MTPRRIAVTGASGFLGMHLLPRLHHDFPDAEIYRISSDIRDKAAVAREIETCEPDVFFHLAAIASVATAKRNPQDAWDINLHGSLHVAEALLHHAPNCLMVFSSTADAYGGSFSSNLPLDETALLDPMNIYAATKAAADLALGAMARDGLNCIRLRLFNQIGPGQQTDYAVASIARQIALIAGKHQSAVIKIGNLDSCRDFLDVRDACAAFSQCVQVRSTLPRGSVINICSGMSRSVGDILRDFIDVSRTDATIEQDPARMRPSDIPVARGNGQRALDLLNWSPKIAWTQSLLDVLDFWKAHPDWHQ